MRTKSIAACLGAALVCLAAPAIAQKWQQLPGAANDIGVGANGTAWAIGTDAQTNGFGIFRWSSTKNAWDHITGAAVRIDVDPQGNPWVVNAAGNIFRYAGTTWQQVPGKAKDIGIGANGTVWVIGTDPQGSTGFGIHRWNPARNTWEQVMGAAVRIDVDPKGNPWVVNNANNIYRYDGKTWSQVPGQAIDIGIGGDGSVYAVGIDRALYKWNGSGWNRSAGSLTDISVDGKGNPWGINAGKEIFATGLAAPPAPLSPAKPVKIGDRTLGGIVFHVTDGGKHGLVADLQDIDTKWRRISWTAAVEACKRSSAGGFSDWVLPSSEQLGLLWRQKELVGGFHAGHNDDQYWSSSKVMGGPNETWQGKAYYTRFETGASAWADTFDEGPNRPLFYARAIRKF